MSERQLFCIAFIRSQRVVACCLSHHVCSQEENAKLKQSHQEAIAAQTDARTSASKLLGKLTDVELEVLQLMHMQRICSDGWCRWPASCFTI